MPNCSKRPSAFLLPTSARIVQSNRSTLSFSARSSPRRPHVTMSMRRKEARRMNPLHALLIAAGGVAGSFVAGPRQPFHPLPEAHAVTTNIVESNRGSAPMPLSALGVKREEFLGDRELRRRKTTQYSDAEQEIMELEEWEVETQWFRDLQALWAGIASVGGIYVLYKGGVMWENWIKEQEKKDMEEEIKLTGTFIDPRAVRKEEDDDGGKKKEKDKPKKDPEGPTDESGDAPPGGLDSLEKLFGSN